MGYPFRFSVVMAVYQVKEYIHEAVDSVIHQTIGFKHIQLILVDDGSTDGSGAICDEYKEQYPEQVTVIHKENGGVSSAKSAGVQVAHGKYVSFLDPDDYLDKDAFRQVESFMDHQGERADICSIPMVFFGAQKGEHILNDKFREGTRVVNLLEDNNADCIQMSNASAFYRLEAAKKMQFDGQLATAEDAKENYRILIDNPVLGILPGVKYHYRKRDNSAISKSERNPKWYFSHITFFSKWVLNRSKEHFGDVPLFIQNAVMYDLQWKLNQERIPAGVLNEEEEARYRDLVYECVSQIDDAVILKQKDLSNARKLFALRKKQERLGDKEQETGANKCFLSKNVQVESFSIANYYPETVFELFQTDKKNNVCTVEGYYSIATGDKEQDYEPVLVINGKENKCESTDRSSVEEYCIGERITDAFGFRGSFTVTDKTTSVLFALKGSGELLPSKAVATGTLFPIASAYRNAYALRDHLMICLNGNMLEIKRNPSVFDAFAKEIRWLAEIWKKNLENGRRAILIRTYYHLTKPFKRRKLWIISDRVLKAGDNGEAFFRYLMQHRQKGVRTVYAISKQSSDYQRVRELGPCVNAPSIRYALLSLHCDIIISSSADPIAICPAGNNYALRDILTQPKYVFLQHGITKDDISDWLNRYNIRMDGFVTSAQREYESIIHGKYGFPESCIWLTGMPRFDRLYHAEQKLITIMPTWREYLFPYRDTSREHRAPISGFFSSVFYQFYHNLLCSEKLISSAEKYGYVIQFLPHPVVRLCEIDFKQDARVVCLPNSTEYRDVYATSSLVITDYSSAVFDFAYLRKPVLYCHFDKERFFSGDHVYSTGYYDYEKDGFGEVTYDLESLIERIIEYMENDCKLKPKYRERIDRFFAFSDTNCCQRVLDKLLSL